MKRRHFLRQAARTMALGGVCQLPPAIRSALAIEAGGDTGTLQDVAHIVVLTQENRSFDHYFGSLKGVRGFSDRFSVPLPGVGPSRLRTVWQQARTDGKPGTLQPFHLDTRANFALMRAEGTPHTWPDAQQAWAEGRLDQWTQAKGQHALGYFTQADLPFHYALADAFTVCDAYHCSFQGGTSPNRLFLWTGSNDPHGLGNGPATFNDLSSFETQAGRESYSWTTYPQRLQAAGISWQVYQDINDNFDDNPLAYFKEFRDAHAGVAGSSAELRARACSTRSLEQLKADVLAGQLPQVSWIVAGELDSEHPGPSSPAQGADFTARVLEALTARPEVWSRTVLILNFDENDGYFDHMPPPAVPSWLSAGADGSRALRAGDSTVDTHGEYHEKLLAYRSTAADRSLLHRPYGLGPRVPMLVISPWSRGGWVNSQVFDHTSVIRFMERRFGVMEPNISAWRRAVCGDLTSALDFRRRSRPAALKLPPTAALAARARALPGRSMPVAPVQSAPPRQTPGTRRSRALPYQFHVHCNCQAQPQTVRLEFINVGTATAVFHVYDRLHLDQLPRRYTVEPGKTLTGDWLLADASGDYDLWLLGPNGFHRHFTGQLSRLGPHSNPEVEISYDPARGELVARLDNRTDVACTLELSANAYFGRGLVRYRLAAGAQAVQRWNIRSSGCWYDFSLRWREQDAFVRRFAGRMETGADSISDPAVGA